MVFFKRCLPEISFLLIAVYTINGDALENFVETSRSTCNEPDVFDDILPAPVPKFTDIPGISDDVYVIYPTNGGPNMKKLCESYLCAKTEADVGKLIDKLNEAEAHYCECVKCAEDETTIEKVIRMANNVIKYMTAISIHLSRLGTNQVEKQLRINMRGPQLFQECKNTLILPHEDIDELELYEYIVNSINWGVHPKLYRQVLEIAGKKFNLEEKFCLSDPGTIPHLKCLQIDQKQIQHQQYCYFWTPWKHLLSDTGKIDFIEGSFRTLDDLDPSFDYPKETNKITSNSPYLYTWTVDEVEDYGSIEIFGEPGAVCSDTHGLNIPCLDTYRLQYPWDFPNKSWFLKCEMGVCGGPDHFYQKLYANTKTIFSPTTLTEVTGKTDPSEGLGGVINQLLTNSEKTEPNTYCSVRMWEYAEGKYFEESGIGARDYGTDELIYTFENIKRKFKWRFDSFLKSREAKDEEGIVNDIIPLVFACLKHGFGVKNRKDCVEFTGTIGCLSELPSMTCKRINQDDRCICRGDPKPFNYKEVNGQCVASEDSICTTANGLVPCEEGFECKSAFRVEDELPNVLIPFKIKTCQKISKNSKNKEKPEESKSSIHSKLSFEFIIMLNLILTIFA